MAVNLRDYDWQTAAERLATVFGERPIRISDSGKQALICAEQTVMAICKVYGEDPQVSIHLRASLLPSAAGYITAVIGVVVPITIDEMFEYDYSGKLLSGDAAVEFAANNIKDLWFGFKDKKTGPKHNRPRFLS